MEGGRHWQGHQTLGDALLTALGTTLSRLRASPAVPCTHLWSLMQDTDGAGMACFGRTVSHG